MRHPAPKIIITTVAVAGVLGAGVAVAAGPGTGTGTCPYGNTPQAGKIAPAKTGDQIRDRLRARDGTGPRHEQMSARHGQRGPMGHHGQGAGNRGADCPYRS